MKNIKYFLAILLCFVAALTTTACNFGKKPPTELEKIVKIFQDNAEYLNDSYDFYKQVDYNNKSYLYLFSFNEKSNFFGCTLRVSNNDEEQTSDYGTVLFEWGKFKTGYFSGTHKITDIASLEIKYTDIEFSGTQLTENYTYNLISNTFNNITEESEIKYHADICYNYIQLAVDYAKSILLEYDADCYLW